MTTGRLVEQLWDDDPPGTAANMVQVYVSRLRRVIAPAAGASPLRSTGRGYVLDIAQDAVDAFVFEDLAERGRRLLAEGDPAGAGEVLRSALALWRGPALPDLDGGRAGEGSLARLAARHAAALGDRLQADIDAGRHAAVVPELQELVRVHPLDERLVGQLMTALYRCGRQAEALTAFQDTGARLSQELGVDPGPQLRGIHLELLRHGAALDAPVVAVTSPRAAVPAAAPTVDGSGQPVPGDVATVPVQRPRPPVRPRTSLVGRRSELAETLALLARPDVRLVTLLGPGGTGKTRLALEVVSQLTAEAAGPRVVMVPLASVVEAEALLPEICGALGASADWRDEPVLDVVARAAAGREILLVLDNLEQVVEKEGAVDRLADLLDVAPTVTMLGTSRTALRLRGEHELRLAPLPLPPEAQAGEEVLSSDAVQLFVQRAVAVMPDFVVTRDNAAAVAGICRMLDGLPLALELAAARVRILPPEEMLPRLAPRLKLLTGGARDLPARHRSIRAALDWSAQLLDAAETDLFARLSVFTGGWTVDAAEAVCGPGPAGETIEDPDVDVIDVLARLVDKSLVVADGSGRLAMLGMVREYASERLPAAERRALRDRHARYVADLAEELGPAWQEATDNSARERLDAESANVLAALDHAAGAGMGAVVGRIVAALLDYWFYSGRIRQSERWVRTALAADVPKAVRARLLQAVGSIAFVEGDLARAAPAFEEAHSVAAEVGDAGMVVRTLGGRAVTARWAGRTDEALSIVREALAAARAEHSPLATMIENELGELLDEVGRTPEALPLWEGFLAWATQESDDTSRAYALLNLARHADERGDAEGAEALVTKALGAAQAADSAPVRGDVLAAAGLVDLHGGRPWRAAARLREAVRLMHAAGQVVTMPDAISLLGAALLDTGTPHVAARLLATGAAWREARGLAVVGRAVRDAIAAAEDRVASALTVEELATERAAGGRAPYGSLDALGQLHPPVVVDLRSDGEIDTWAAQQGG
jgi:predicted ATPase/DNA-binding SARP family transcriptional activator